MKTFTTTTTALSLLLASSIAQAVPTTFFGEDIGGGETTVLSSTPNSDNAQASFLAQIVNPGIETFEGITGGTSNPGITFGNGVTASITGGTVESLADGVTNGFGRYGVTGDVDKDERYLETNSNAFTISFSESIAAFGFYGIDIGDFNGTITATTTGGLSHVFDIGNSTNISGGSVLFWGIVDTVDTFSSISFGNTGSSADYFGFDDFTVGSIEQVQVPEPSTLALFGLGLVGFQLSRRNKAK